METLKKVSKPIALVMVCALLSIASFGNQVSLGSKVEVTYQTDGSALNSVGAAYVAAAAIAAGVALYAGAITAAYDAGTIIGHALYDFFGESYIITPETLEQYDGSDFSKFDA